MAYLKETYGNCALSQQKMERYPNNKLADSCQSYTQSPNNDYVIFDECYFHDIIYLFSYINPLYCG